MLAPWAQTSSHQNCERSVLVVSAPPVCNIFVIAAQTHWDRQGSNLLHFLIRFNSLDSISFLYYCLILTILNWTSRWKMSIFAFFLIFKGHALRVSPLRMLLAQKKKKKKNVVSCRFFRWTPDQISGVLSVPGLLVWKRLKRQNNQV